ncbi:PEP-CTERM sorting domain-containing protein [Cellvibrio sp. UBA7671]|uniref:PEP-CTERM sorting domain-containing protein n=1 Tax=Cellvibrio sp. UBA7671 TaxID=1946312 RepID=UPI002F34F472
MKILTSLVIFCLSAVALSSNATIIWDESINGSSEGMPMLNLQMGANEILGSTRWIGDDIDPFIYTEANRYVLSLQEGYSIKSITAEIFNSVLDSQESLDSLWATTFWSLQDFTYDFKWYEYTRIGEPSPYASFSNLPLNGFNNFLLNQAAGLSISGPFDLSWDYRVTIEVVNSVPEPSSLWLVLFALAVIFGHKYQLRNVSALCKIF